MYQIFINYLFQLIEFEYLNETAGIENNPKRVAIFPIVNFHWDREIIENTDDRIAIRFMGTNYTAKNSFLKDTWIKGEINLTVIIIIWVFLIMKINFNFKNLTTYVFSYRFLHMPTLDLVIGYHIYPTVQKPAKLIFNCKD